MFIFSHWHPHTCIFKSSLSLLTVPVWGYLLESVCPFSSPQSATNIPTSGSNNNSDVSSPWLSIAARLAGIRMGPSRITRRLGTLQCGVSISVPHDLEAGEIDTGFQCRRKGRGGTGRECGCWDLRPCLYKAPLGVCSKEGPKPAHRLRATKEGRVSVREGGRARERDRKRGPHRSCTAS